MTSITLHALIVQSACRDKFHFFDSLDYLRLLVLSPVLEECIVRSGLQHYLIKKYPSSTSISFPIWGSALAFSCLHAAQGAQSMLAVFVPGLALSYLYQRTRKVWLCALLHSFFNAVLLVVCKL